MIKKCYRVGIDIINRFRNKITDSWEFSLVLVVGQACNLKCINCGNFCPMSLPETKRYDVQSIIESLDILLHNSHRISYLQIQGGEPFVYSDLVKLMAWLKGQKRIETIEFATNGMVIPSDDVLDTIKRDNRIGVRISDYNISDTAKQLKVILDEMKIRNSYYEFAGNTGKWIDLGGVDMMPVNDEEANMHFKTCAFNTCLTLENGELTYCSRAANAYKLQNFVRDASDYLRVEDSEDFATRLKEFVRNPHPMEACRYCNGTAKGEIIAPAIQP